MGETGGESSNWGAVEQRRNNGDWSDVLIGLDENKSCSIENTHSM